MSRALRRQLENAQDARRGGGVRRGARRADRRRRPRRASSSSRRPSRRSPRRATPRGRWSLACQNVAARARGRVHRRGLREAWPPTPDAATPSSATPSGDGSSREDGPTLAKKLARCREAAAHADLLPRRDGRGARREPDRVDARPPGRHARAAIRRTCRSSSPTSRSGRSARAGRATPADAEAAARAPRVAALARRAVPRSSTADP